MDVTTETKECLTVKNFAGIKTAEFELGRMNLFIGPQASGKSVCAKLIFYFKEIFRRLPVDIESFETKPLIRAEHRRLFALYFPESCWGDDEFAITYSCGAAQVSVTRKKAKASTSPQIEYSAVFDELLVLLRKNSRKTVDLTEGTDAADLQLGQRPLRDDLTERLCELKLDVLSNINIFIPAGRSFFSALHSNVFGFLVGNVQIDPFMALFGRLYELSRSSYLPSYRMQRQPNGPSSKMVKDRLARILGGNYLSGTRLHHIETEDGRRVPVESCSSGQQEALPLAIVLLGINRLKQGFEHSTVFVEEPEAHLFPSAQREIVHLLVDILDLASSTSSSQYVVTTHSPYILTALNNLMYGDELSRNFQVPVETVRKITGSRSTIDSRKVRAYMFENGKVSDIIDSETNLVNATAIDGVSDVLAVEFDKLQEIEYKATRQGKSK